MLVMLFLLLSRPRPSSFPTNTPHVFACHNIWLKAYAYLLAGPFSTPADGGREAVSTDGCEAVYSREAGNVLVRRASSTASRSHP